MRITLLWWVALPLAAFSSRAANLVWTNGAGGDWSVSENWNPNLVPGAADAATLAVATTVSVNAPETVGSLTFSGGTLTGTGNLAVTATMTWSGGTLAGTGAITIGPGGTLNLSGSTKGFVQRTINNAGTIRWTAGDLWSGSSATINNQSGGLLDLQGDSGWLHNLGGDSPVLNNTGTVRKSGGTGTTPLNVFVMNGGTFEVQSGTVSLNEGGDSQGVFNASAGTTLNFGGGTMTLETNSIVSGAGTNAFSGGTVLINGTYSVQGTTLLNGATVNFNSGATTHDATCSAGILSGTGNLAVI